MRVRAFQGSVHEVGPGLGRLHVAGARPSVGEPARAEQVDVVLDLGLLGGACEDDRVAAVA
ncbi:MAG: hypothetical protein WB998_06635 [Solirubrobacteraceae bacterium]